MSKHIRLPADVKPSAHMKLGKGWRLVNPKKSRSLKAALMTTYTNGRDRFAVFLLTR